MADEEHPMSKINIFPNEILLYIFQYFTVKTLVISRRVCRRWKDLIDDKLCSDDVWESNCAKDFSTVYKQAKFRTPHCETWYDLYKSLSLWERLNGAKETIDEFCYSQNMGEEICGIKLLEKGLLCVHRRSSVTYYDLVSQEISNARPLIDGNFNRVYERGDIFILHGDRLDLLISRWKHAPGVTIFDRQELVAMFHHVKFFLVHDNDLYFASINNEIFKLGIYHESPLKTYPNTHTSIVALSVYNGLFHVITIGRSILAFVNNKFEEQLRLDSVPNIIHTLWQYNLLEEIDWNVFYIWTSELRIKIAEGPMKKICSLRIYGDLFFVGSKCGILSIFYKPFIDGQLNLFDSEPIKQYNFSERHDIPVLSSQPIKRVEVMEGKHGHKIIVAMPKKIQIINLSHDHGCSASKALLPYQNLESKLDLKPDEVTE